MAGQGGRLRHPGPRGGVRALDSRVLFQRRRAGAFRDLGPLALGRRGLGIAAVTGRGQALPTKGADIFVRVRGAETAVLVAQEGEPVEWRVAVGDVSGGLGAIYRARVAKVVPGLDAAFVDLGGGVSGFLAAAEAGGPHQSGGGIAKRVREGQTVTVEVIREAEGAKGPRLARRTAMENEDAKGPAPALLEPAPPLAARMVRDWPDRIRRIVVDDVDALLALKSFCLAARPEAADKIRRFAGTGDMIEAEGLADRLHELLEDWVRLPSGGRINLQPTPALIAVDVDSGRDADAGRPDETARRTNREAAAEIPRQLRLRGLSGLVVCGFMPMRLAAHRAEVLRALKSAAAPDPCAAHVGGFTRFGLVELTRARV
ncbi:MAG: ribonuclease E/G, partial [Alphaproteobacteria bacterium]|nr:ribonuclease E/G [Alphaproteobacteria bacterium]